MIKTELTISQTSNTKGIAILMMLCLHLFNQPYQGLFEPLVFIGSTPLTYYISLFCDCCVAIYCFSSGYGLYIGFTKSQDGYIGKNYNRILKLYINYWIVVVLFAVLLGSILANPAYPGSWLKFILNFLALSSSYNGAWWFFLSYVLLVFSSPIIFRGLNKLPIWVVVPAVWIFYSATYIQRITNVIQTDNVLVSWIINQLALYGNCLFPFVAGALFYKYNVYSRFYERIATLRFPNLALLILIGCMVILHGFVPSLYVAVFTGVAFILCFNALQLPSKILVFLQYMGKHSTNLWLIHLFFTLAYFRGMVYAPKNPILIFSWLLFLTLISSLIVEYINKKISHAISVIPNLIK